MAAFADTLSQAINSFFYFLPESWTAIALCIYLIFGLIFRSFFAKNGFLLTLGIIAILLFCDINQWNHFSHQSIPLFNDLFVLDDLALLSKILIDGLTFSILFLAIGNQSVRISATQFEYSIILLGALIGLHAMSMSTHFLSAYVSLELVSIASYILVGIFFSKKSSSASFYYLLIGAVASGISLFGISWIYGLTGNLYFTMKIGLENIKQLDSVFVLVFFLLAIASFLFKIAAVPFHRWISLVYRSAPLFVIPFLGVASKIAGLILLVRLFFSENYLSLINWQSVLCIIAMASMCVGNIGALRQSSVRAMLGYSSIAHIGFLLIGIITHTSFGIDALLFYLVAYLMMNIAVFFIIHFFSLDKEDNFDSYKGLGMKFPLISVCFSLVMVALIGLPPTIGFSAKFFIFSGLWSAYQTHSDSIFLITFIVGLLNIVVSLFYYLRIPYYLFFEKRQIDSLPIHFSYWQKVVIFILSIILLILFFFAGELFKAIQTIQFNF